MTSEEDVLGLTISGAITVLQSMKIAHGEVENVFISRKENH